MSSTDTTTKEVDGLRRIWVARLATKHEKLRVVIVPSASYMQALNGRMEGVCMHLARHNKTYQTNCLQSLPCDAFDCQQALRRHIAAAFSASALVSESRPPLEAVASAAELCRRLSSKLLGFPHGIIPKTVCRSPPCEVYAQYSADESVDAYLRFCEWVRGFRHFPFGADLFRSSGITLQHITKDGAKIGSPFISSIDDVVIPQQRENMQWNPTVGMVVEHKDG